MSQEAPLKSFPCTLPHELRSRAYLRDSTKLRQWKYCRILVVSSNVTERIFPNFQPLGNPVNSNRNLVYRQEYMCGETTILETSPSSEWNEKNKEEFKVRAAAQTSWGKESLRPSGFFSRHVLGRSYARESFDMENMPNVVVISSEEQPKAIEFVQRISSKNEVPVVVFDPKNPEQAQNEIKKAIKGQVLETAVQDIKNDAHKKGYDSGYSVGYQVGYQVGSVTERYEKGLKESMGQSRDSSQSFPECVCPLSNLPFQSPVITPSGITYEQYNIEQYVKVNGKDPITGTPLNINQLVPNRSTESVCGKLLSSGIFRR